MRVHVHPRVMRDHPDLDSEDVRSVVERALRSRLRATDPVQWVGVGIDPRGRLLQFVAVEKRPDEWVVFHAKSATRGVLRELGVGEEPW